MVSWSVFPLLVRFWSVFYIFFFKIFFQNDVLTTLLIKFFGGSVEFGAIMKSSIIFSNLQ